MFAHFALYIREYLCPRYGDFGRSLSFFLRRLETLREWHRVFRTQSRLLFIDAMIVTGILSNEEIATRSWLLFTAASTGFTFSTGTVGRAKPYAWVRFVKSRLKISARGEKRLDKPP